GSRLAAGLGLGFLGALLVGGVGMPEALGAIGAFGNPLLLSAALPLVGIALLYGVARLRPALAGLAFGVAGALAFGAVAYVADVRFMPDFLDRAWLVVNAGLAFVVGMAALNREKGA